jgi:hypothetical protein
MINIVCKFLRVVWGFYKGMMVVFVFAVVFLVISLFYDYFYTREIGSALLGLSFGLWQQRYQDRQKQFYKIQNALVAFESTRLTSLIFIEKLDNSKKELDDFLRRNQIVLDKELHPLSSVQTKNWHLLTERNGNSFLQFFPAQHFYSISFSEILGFIAEKNPKILLLLRKAYEAIMELDPMIKNRNFELTKYRSSSEEPETKAIQYIDTYKNILSNLIGINDNIIAFHNESYCYLIEYAKKYYCVKEDQIFQKKMITRIDDLMPKQNHLDCWRQEFEKL